jgi:hypothetical protein
MTEAIFPGLCLDVSYNIFNLSGDCDLMRLSEVNRNASKLLSNEYFKNRLNTLYPFIVSMLDPNSILPTLQDRHPQSCWKMICSIFSKNVFLPFNSSFVRRETEIHRDLIFSGDFYLPFNLSFVKRETEIYRDLLKSEQQKKLLEICSFCDTDEILTEPQNLQEEGVLRGRRLKLLFPADVHSKEQLEKIYDWLELYGEFFFSHSDEEIERMSGSELGELDRHWICRYRSSMRLISQRDPRSPIEQALKLTIRMCEEIQELKETIALRESELKSLFPSGVHSEEKLEEICDWLKRHGETLFSHLDEEIENMPDEELGELNRQWIPQYRSSMQFIDQLSQLSQVLYAKSIEHNELRDQYFSLEDERFQIQSRIARQNDRPSDDSLYVNKIKQEWGSLKQQSVIDALKECANLIDKLTLQIITEADVN